MEEEGKEGREGIVREAATEMVYQNIWESTLLQFSRRVYLFIEQTCFFPGGSICLSKRHVFYRRVYLSVCGTDSNFPRNLLLYIYIYIYIYIQ